MKSTASVILLVTGLFASYISTESINHYGSLSSEVLEILLFSIISYLVAIIGFVYTIENIDKAILNTNSKGKFFILYNILKFILGVILIILGFMSLYATFASNSIIWGIIFTFSFFVSGVHIILSVIKLIKLK